MNRIFGLSAVAFKEWWLICDALAAGIQSVILRKGGIAEGQRGFYFKHDRFWLYPTQFHTQKALISSASMNQVAASRYQETSPDIGEPILLDLFATIERKKKIDHWETVKKLENFHIWNEEIIRERFNYEKNSSLWFAFIRVYRTENPLFLQMNRSFQGCRSWIKLPDEAERDRAFHPILSDEKFAKLLTAIEQIL